MEMYSSRREIMLIAAGAVASSLRAQTISNEEDWDRVRAAFRLDPRHIDLSTGGVSPSPLASHETRQREWDEINASPELYHRLRDATEKEPIRQRLARLISAEPGEIALVRNTTEAMNTAIFGLNLKSGDEVLTTTHDYDTMLRAWKQRELRDGIRLVQADVPLYPRAPGEMFTALARRITRRTRVLMVSHMVFMSGQIYPVHEIGELCRKHNLIYMIDGAHGFAHIPVNVRKIGCDFYGTSLHKWLSAPHGTGFLYVRKERIAGLWPLLPDPFFPAGSADIRKLEGHGTVGPIWSSVGPALDLHEAIGPVRKQARIHELKLHWAERLSRDPRFELQSSLLPRDSCGIAFFKAKGVTDSVQFSRRMRKEHGLIIGVSVPSSDPLFPGYQQDALCISTQVFTTKAELDRAIEILLRAV